MKKTKLLSIMLIITLVLGLNSTNIHASTIWEEYYNFAQVECETIPKKINNNNNWSVKLKQIGHGGIWCAQMYTKNIPFINFNKKYQLHCTLKSSNCDKWIFIKIPNAYGKWLKLKKGKPATINEIFAAQATTSDCLVFSFGGEHGNSEWSIDTDYSFILGGKAFIAANPDPNPATSTTITCSGFYLGNVINKTSLSKIKRTGSKAKITMKRVKNIKGYEIQYSTTKKFKIKKTKVISSKKNSYTIKKLKKNTKYYVRTRAYVKASNEKVYSKWSKIKTIPKK